MGWLLRLVTGAPLVVGGPRQFYFILNQKQWCIAENGGGYMQRGVPKGLKVPCLFMIAEVSIRCPKNPEVGIRRIPAYTPQYTTGYDTRCYFNVRSKADISQLNLPHGTDN